MGESICYDVTFELRYPFVLLVIICSKNLKCLCLAKIRLAVFVIRLNIVTQLLAHRLSKGKSVRIWKLRIRVEQSEEERCILLSCW